MSLDSEKFRSCENEREKTENVPKKNTRRERENGTRERRSDVFEHARRREREKHKVVDSESARDRFNNNKSQVCPFVS